jgi:hypothetical protein
MKLTVLDGVIAIHDTVRRQNEILKSARGAHICVIKNQRIGDWYWISDNHVLADHGISYLRVLVQGSVQADH